VLGERARFLSPPLSVVAPLQPMAIILVRPARAGAPSFNFLPFVEGIAFVSPTSSSVAHVFFFRSRVLCIVDRFVRPVRFDSFFT